VAIKVASAWSSGTAKPNTPASKAITIRAEAAPGTERSDKGTTQWAG
jgi:hypothetical protein